MTGKHFAFLAIVTGVIWLAGIPRAMRQDEERHIAHIAERAVKHPHPAASCVDLFEEHDVDPPLWLLSLEEYELAQQQPLLREAARMQAEIEMYREELVAPPTPCWGGAALVPVTGCYGLWLCPDDVHGGTHTREALALCARGEVR